MNNKNSALDLLRHLTALRKAGTDLSRLTVYLDGCDCTGEWSGSSRGGEKSLALTRKEDS